MRRTLLLLIFASTPAARADSLADAELKELRAYLVELRSGRPASAATVERLAGLSFASLVETVKTYVALIGAIEPQTHRAFQMLLERISREAHAPWPVVQLYSPEFARWLIRPPDDETRGFLSRLLTSDNGRVAVDLCVRLTPAASLEYLASARSEKRAELFDAWNRRLARSCESRPLPELDGVLQKIAADFSLKARAVELEAHLRFLGSWPSLRDVYRRELERSLSNESETAVLAGLAVQHRIPTLLERNEKVLERWKNSARIVEAALRNFAFDESADHSATLRRLWALLPKEQTRARYQCLFAMGIHPRSNDAIALAAVEENAFELIDVALPVLKRGDPVRATRAIRHVLEKSERGHEEALRLAQTLKLSGFEETALKIALDDRRDQILRQTSMGYLGNSEGKYRRRLFPALAFSKADLRLSAIRAFVNSEGLAREDLREIGPTLIRVALADPSPGHRQEAMYALGCWKTPNAMEFFRKMLAENSSVLLTDGYYSDARYWQYRFRLMALLGLARLSDRAARTELLELHRKGSPAERMDVLLAFLELGEVPDAAWNDLDSSEPRLVATAVQLIAVKGDDAAKERLKKKFAAMPLWREFRNSGIDDYNILRTTSRDGK